MNNSNLDELKEHLLEFVAENTSKSKNNFYVCPFCGSGEGQHGTGALWIYEDENRFFCHKCRTGGSIIDFYLNLHNLSNTHENISQAIKELSEKYNIQQSAPYQANQPKRKPKEIERREHIYHNADGSIFGKKTIIKYDDGTKRPFWRRYDKQTKRYISKLTEKAPLYHADKVHNTFDGVIYFVEGEKDVETLESVCRVTATSTPNGGGSKKWIALYNDGLQGKDIIVITDNDETGNAYGKMIARNTIKLAKSVKIIPAATIWSECPPKGDISDIVASIGTEKTQHLLYAAIEKADFYNPESDTDHNQSDSLSREDLPEWVVETKHGLKVHTARLSRIIQEQTHFFFVRDGQMEFVRRYWYDERTGFYTFANISDIESMVKKKIDSFDSDLAKTKDIREVTQLLTMSSNYISETEVNADETLINFRNGVLDWNTGRFSPHSPDFRITVQVNADYVPGKAYTLDDAPMFKKYLEDLTEGNEEKRKLLLEYIGACISNVHGYNYKQALFLIGETDSGKSQIVKLICDLLGSQNFATVDFKNLDDRFQTAHTYGKRLICAADTTFDKGRTNTIFMNYTGGDAVAIEYKGQMPFNAIYNGFLLFSSNKMPVWDGNNTQAAYTTNLWLTDLLNEYSIPAQRKKQQFQLFRKGGLFIYIHL